MKFYATFLLRLSIYYWTSSMKHGKVTHFWNHGEKLWLFQFPNSGRIILIYLIIDLLLSQVAFVKLLKEWSMNVLYGIWTRMVYWLNNSVVIGQIDRQLIIKSALRHLLKMLLSTINTWLLFSLICKKRTIPRGNTVSSKAYIAWDYEEIYPFLLAFFYPTELFKSI